MMKNGYRNAARPALLVADRAAVVFAAGKLKSLGLSGVVREQTRRRQIAVDACGLALGLKRGHMVERQLADGDVLRLGGGGLARVAAKDDDVEQTVAHHKKTAVAAVYLQWMMPEEWRRESVYRIM